MTIRLVNKTAADIVWEVEQDGKVIGRISKASGSQFPWRAYLRYETQYGGPMESFLDSFYPSEGGKSAAVKEVVEAAERVSRLAGEKKT